MSETLRDKQGRLFVDFCEVSIDTLCPLLIISFGLFDFLAPRDTASALDLEPTKSTMGLSEIRASVGGLFVVAGLAALKPRLPLRF